MINPDRNVVVVDGADPQPPGPDGAGLTIEATSICGSDLHFYDGDLPVIAPTSVGHEFVGRVSEVGPAVREVKVGDRVMCSCIAGCGYCERCASGDPVTCENGSEIFGTGTGV